MLFATEMKDWADVAERLGIPFAILLMIFLTVLPMLWLAIRWLGKMVAEPLIKSHVSLVETLRVTNETNTAINQQNTSINQQNANTNVRLADVIEKKADALTDMAQTMRRCLDPAHVILEPSPNGTHEKQEMPVKAE